MPTLTKNQGRLLFAGLILAAGFFFLFRLGANAFLDYDEATYAQVVKEAMDNKEYCSFNLWGQRWIDKPPLYFWLAIGSAKVFEFNELALRLPSALLGILAVIITWLLAFRLTKNYFTAFLAGAILALSGEFAFAARQVRLDVPVAAAVLASVYFFIRGWENSKWFLAMGAALAAGVLTKSVVGLFALPAMFAFSLAYKKWDYLKSGWFWGGPVFMFGLLFPWHYIETKKYGIEFWNTYVGHHLFSRVAAPIQGSGITVWHYFKYLFFLVEPWMAVMAALVIWQIARHGKKWKEYNPLSLASFLSFIFIFSIFAVSKTRLFYYLEPIYPFMAIFIAASLFDFLEWMKPEKKAARNFILILLFLGLCNTIWQVIELRENFSSEYETANLEKEAGLKLA
ncbi:MAG: glycosyltransferase family 39 protein, partial [Patescibacteria group bacterium]